MKKMGEMSKEDATENVNNPFEMQFHRMALLSYMEERKD
jgi:hypothetical protein